METGQVSTFVSSPIPLTAFAAITAAAIWLTYVPRSTVSCALVSDIRLLIPFVIGNDQIDRLSDHLGFRIAEHAFGGLVPADDQA